MRQRKRGRHFFCLPLLHFNRTKSVTNNGDALKQAISYCEARYDILFQGTAGCHACARNKRSSDHATKDPPAAQK